MCIPCTITLLHHLSLSFNNLNINDCCTPEEVPKYTYLLYGAQIVPPGTKLVILYTTQNIFQTTIFLIIIVRVITWGHGYTSWMRPIAQCGGEKVRTTRLRIGHNCRAVCTKKSGLNALGHRDALSNDWHESATFREVHGLLRSHWAKQEASSVLYHTCQ